MSCGCREAAGGRCGTAATAPGAAAPGDAGAAGGGRGGARGGRCGGGGRRRSRNQGRLARAKLTGHRVEPRRELVHASGERRQRLAQAVDLTAERRDLLVTLAARTVLELRRDGVGVGLGARGGLLRRRDVLANLEEMLLGRDPGCLRDSGAN